MTNDQYIKDAMSCEADQTVIQQRLASNLTMVRADNACRGLIADAGELAGCIQKWIEYGRDLDLVNLKEEMGDVLWRIAQLCSTFDWSLDDIQIANLSKLKDKKLGRYKDGYSDKAANVRDLEAESRALYAKEQTGQGWAEPLIDPEEDVFGHAVRESYVRGLEDGLAEAIALTHWMDGQVREGAVKQIETRRKMLMEAARA